MGCLDCTIIFFSAVHGLDEQFQEYKCPVFMGCLVTVSGLGSQERKEVKKLVEKEGKLVFAYWVIFHAFLLSADFYAPAMTMAGH